MSLLTDIASTSMPVTEPKIGGCSLCGNNRLQLLQSISTSVICDLVQDDAAADVAQEFGVVDRIDYYHCLDCDLRFFHPAVTGSERFYEQLQMLESYYPVEKPEFEFARRYIHPNDTVLEVGCGSGAFGAQAHVAQYVGLEFSAKAAAAARIRGLTVLQESVEGHARSKPAAYDVICTFQVLEHVAQVELFLRGCLAALKPGGLLIISVPSADSFARGIPNFVLDLPPHHVTRWTDRCLGGLPKLLPVDLVALWHEPLQPVHLRMYIQSVLNRMAYGLVAKIVPAVEPGRIAAAVLSLNWKVSRLLAPLFPANKVRGISVTAVYRKASS